MVLEMKWIGSQVTEVVTLGMQVISSVTLEISLFSGFSFPFQNEGSAATLLLGPGEEYMCIRKHVQGCSWLGCCECENLKTRHDGPWQPHVTVGFQVGPQ